MKDCSSGKTAYRTQRHARYVARLTARALNHAHEYSVTLYIYTCPECGAIHLTHRKSWHGHENTLVFTAPPRALQDWAMESDAE